MSDAKDISSSDFHGLLRDLTLDREFSDLGMEEALLYFCKFSASALQAQRVGVWVLTENGEDLKSLVQWDQAVQRVSAEQVLMGENAASYLQAVRSDYVIKVDDAMNDPRCRELAKAYLLENQITSMLDCPVHNIGGLIGVLCIEHVGPKRNWLPDEVNFAVAVSGLISLTIENNARRGAEQSSKENAERLKFYAELAADWFWETDANFVLKNVRGAPSRVGLDIASLVGTNIWEIPEFSPKGFDWAALRDVVVNRKEIREFVITAVSADGTEFYTELTGRPIFSESGEFQGYWGIAKDVTDRIRREKALESSEQKYRNASRLAKLGNWIWDEIEGRCVYCSPELAEIYGISVETFLRRTASFEKDLLWIHPDDRERYRAVTTKAVRDRTGYDIVARIVRDDGQVRSVREKTEAVLDDNGQVIETAGVTRDITDHLETQMALNQSQKMEAVGQLTGGIAHDFNNLLAVILGNLELLKDETDDTAMSKLIDAGISAASRGGNLTKSLLSFARQAPLEPTILDLNEIVRENRNWMGRTLPANIFVETDLADDIWPVEADSILTASAMLNLIVNARDAMPDGGSLLLKTENVTIPVEGTQHKSIGISPGNYAVVTVADSGKGMPSAVAAKIFEPFFTTKKAGAGSGLGLSMVQGFMEQSGGAVRVQSQPGAGTTFKLYFQACEDVAVEPAVPESDAQLLGTCDARILVAEDDKEVRQVVTSVLEKAGFVVHAASSGDEARAKFVDDPTFDLLVSDMSMPGQLQGRDLVENLREIKPDLRALLMTGYENAGDAISSGNSSETKVLKKPVGKAELIGAVTECLLRTQ